MIAVLLALMGLGILSMFAGDDDGGGDEGTEGADGYLGTEEANTFSGNGGSDLLAGFGGDDVLSGGDGGDWIFALDGNDSVSGDSGNDVIVGGEGADTLAGGTGNDFVEAANVIDEPALLESLKSARALTDIVFQYDLSQPSDAGDLVDLGEGNDTVVMGSDDTITGGSGADKFSGGDWIEPGNAAIISDYDADEDVITFAYDANDPTPVLDVFLNKQTGHAHVRSGNQDVVVVENAGSDFTISMIKLTPYSHNKG